MKNESISSESEAFDLDMTEIVTKHFFNATSKALIIDCFICVLEQLIVNFLAL
jgi:hypothetical protein